MRKVFFLKVLSGILCMYFCLASINVFAYEFPNEFWEPNTKHIEALENNDYHGMIYYGKQIVDIMINEPDCYEKRQVLASKYRDIAVSCTELNDSQNAYIYFKLLYDLVHMYPDELSAWKYISEMGTNCFESRISIYTDNGTAPYFGANNEKRNGVLFGTNADGGVRKAGNLKNESILLTYQELGQELFGYNIGALKEAQKSGCAVELALNCPEEGRDISRIRSLEWSLAEVSELCTEYGDVPIYLRFAAEFNIWGHQMDADEFVDAFRYVSTYFKKRNPNVAIVWCPCHASSYELNLDDYYPGDEYVDFVGISTYASKYFLADRSQDELASMIFKAGKNSNPVVAVSEIIEKFGERKPVLICEMGAGHTVYGQFEEDTTQFALQRLKEYYSYLPMVYPQIKGMLYFDQYVSGERNDYRLSQNSEMKDAFLNLTKGARFIQDGYNNETDFCYRKVTDGISVEQVFPVSCFAYVNGENIDNVVYSIDDNYMGLSTELPFTTYINAGNLNGRHVLKAVAVTESGKTLTTESYIYINSENRDISVEISGDKVHFDQEPVLYNSRTMVPMRKIFEELGADVYWDNDTNTATGERGDRTVEITIGSNRMYLNGKAIMLDTPAILLAGRTLVPVRAIAEGLGCDVDWDDRNSVVEITPKVFKWSDWDKKLPDYVDENMYYIEERTEYRYRTREEEYFTLDFFLNNSQYVRTDTEYGKWSDWQDEYIDETNSVEVDTRIVSTPKQYKYAHYCTGWLEDESKKYRTGSYDWCDECTYHELGWFDNPLPYSSDSTSDYTYIVNGEKYRCKNSCFRWYLLETSGGDITQYRSRNIYKEYIYWKWSDWGRWSSWSYEDPYDSFDSPNVLDVEKRTIYRYKEK